LRWFTIARSTSVLYWFLNNAETFLSPAIRGPAADSTTWGVRYFSELTNLGLLMEEVGEVARIMTRIYGDQSFKPGDDASDLADELADVLFVVCCLANQTGVDLTRAIKQNLEKKTLRDKDRQRNNPKL
jgi:NTP pyrophosphatase (non-canonical NTP hydrolase)